MENEGYNGGALTLDDDSVLYLEANSSITFASNHAYHHGGAIYYIDEYGEEDFESEAVVSAFMEFLLQKTLTQKLLIKHLNFGEWYRLS